MKKLIIVNNNMKVGGVQKSLYNLLWALDGKYDITLLLFYPVGAYLDKLPPSVTVLGCDSLFRYLGISQGECRGSLADTLKRGALAAFCRVFGREAVLKILLASQKTLPDTYDCAISYLQNGRKSNFYGGVQEFVLHRISARRKVAFLHCDYGRSGANYPENNRTIAGFNRIAACSEGCRRAFCRVLPELEDKCVTVRNCHRFEEIRALAEQEPVDYDASAANVVMVSRLAHEKGIDRAMEAAARAGETGIPVKLHIVGSGPMKESLQQKARELGLAEQVCFYGEQENPYRFMKNADLFLLTSYHEAAPMVIEEAACLGLPVLTVQTTSSREMVTEQGIGWVCENSQEALNSTLTEVLSDLRALRGRKTNGTRLDNTAAIGQFTTLIEG